MKALLMKLMSLSAASGSETAMANALRQELETSVDQLETDVLGNLYAVKRGSATDAKTVMLTAPMDTVGYVVTGFEDSGFLRVTNVGASGAEASMARPVQLMNGVRGVLVCEDVPAAERTMKTLYLDIGAADRAEAERMVQLGDMAVFAPDAKEIGLYGVSGSGASARAACAVLARLMKQLQDSRDTVVAVFTAQKELGHRGAQVAGFAKQPDLVLSLEGCPASDTPDSKLKTISLGKGVAVKVMDHNLIPTPAVRDRLLALAKEHDIPVQMEVSAAAADAGTVQRSRGPIPAAALSLPTRYGRTAVETVDVRDMEAGLKLLQAWLG